MLLWHLCKYLTIYFLFSRIIYKIKLIYCKWPQKKVWPHWPVEVTEWWPLCGHVWPPHRWQRSSLCHPESNRCHVTCDFVNVIIMYIDTEGTKMTLQIIFCITTVFPTTNTTTFILLQYSVAMLMFKYLKSHFESNKVYKQQKKTSFNVYISTLSHI